MNGKNELPLPVLDALPLGAHRLIAHSDEGLFRACGVRVMFTSREGGTSRGPFASLNCSPYIGDDARAVERNLSIVREAADAQEAVLLHANQVHGTHIVEVADHADAADARVRASLGADGFALGTSRVAAMLLAADCPLIAVVSPSGRFVIVHAGWRGAVAGIVGKAVARLADGDAYDPASFNAYIGPHICAECFEVQRDVSERFVEEFGDCCVPDERHVSLLRAISVDLERHGIAPRRIAETGACTRCQPDWFFSYRATGGACGRHALLAVRMQG